MTIQGPGNSPPYLSTVRTSSLSTGPSAIDSSDSPGQAIARKTLTALFQLNAPSGLIQAYENQYALIGILPTGFSSPFSGIAPPVAQYYVPSGNPWQPGAPSGQPPAGQSGQGWQPPPTGQSGSAFGGPNTTYKSGDTYAAMTGPNTGIIGTDIAPATLTKPINGPDTPTNGPLKGLEYGSDVEAAATKFGIDPYLLYAQGELESGGNGLDGSIGMVPSTPDGGAFQMTPSWGGSPEGEKFDPQYDGNDPASQAMAAAQADRIMINEVSGNLEVGFSAYNSGNYNELWNPEAIPSKDYHSYYDNASDIGQKIKAYEAGNGNSAGSGSS